MKVQALILSASAALLLSACASAPVANPSGMRTVDVPVDSKGPVQGVGIEGADIVAMTNQMARDLMANPTVAGRSTAPRVIIDSQYFTNDGMQRINKNAITDRLRVELNRASAGRMVFVGRQGVTAMVEEERALKREGVTDSGTVGMARAQFGGDYRLAGRISSLDSRDPRTGVIQRYTQITFQLVDLETAELVWENIYEFQRASADDVIYR
ncbi:penicillin-binding protein activator LpoB [Pseudomarimonas arenosa]|uniref:Penicillin-binding protein activator LpoB n=1 Tax=Pseudomarimonas arenosa TaxID=2774145 RepID=A0AAW3ZSN1_9GAMM|nr:penicillin-binding protein activator LpoB [Pseudomarimonas arenosa]MBD8527211.1 penicillin-binding protein activator LpoB [Pseudomarimonas arenosa]